MIAENPKTWEKGWRVSFVYNRVANVKKGDKELKEIPFKHIKRQGIVSNIGQFLFGKKTHIPQDDIRE